GKLGIVPLDLRLRRLVARHVGKGLGPVGEGSHLYQRVSVVVAGHVVEAREGGKIEAGLRLLQRTEADPRKDAAGRRGGVVVVAALERDVRAPASLEVGVEALDLPALVDVYPELDALTRAPADVPPAPARIGAD